jgi:hypothetical protein
MVTHNRSKNGRGARVVLCSHPAHTLTQKEQGCGGIDWIHLAQVRDRWRGNANAVMKFRVP